MPTIKDIAKAAGVSHGTVSNVLNGRGNVSLEKITLVEEAARKMGYQIHARAKSLREGSSTTVSLILPNISSDSYNKLYIAIHSTLLRAGYTTNLYLTQDQKENEQALLQEIAANRDCAVITVSCLDDAMEYYDLLGIPRENIIFVYRKLQNTMKFASFDAGASGRASAQKIKEKAHRKIGIFTDLLRYSCDREFRNAIIEELSPLDLRIHTIAAAQSTAYNHAFDFFAGDGFDCIVTSDLERARYIKNAHFLGSTGPCPEIYSLADSEFLTEDFIHKYHINYQWLGKEIAETILRHETTDQRDGAPIIGLNRGFMFDDQAPSHPTANKTLNILTIPSPTTDALKKLAPHFKKTTGIDLRLAVYSFEEIYDILSDIDNHKHYDIIRVDMAGLSWFADRTLKPLSPEMQELLTNYPPQLIDRYAYVNEIPYAVPFDPSIQMLFYRKDIFEDTKVRRMFYEQYKAELRTPSDFEAFNRISAFFSRASNPESPLPHGSCVTTGNSEIIASEFLVRYYAEGGHLIQEDNKLALSKEIAINALHSYIDHLSIAKTLPAKWWDESISLFEDGQIAMLIVYMNLFSNIAHSEISPLVGFAEVPGQQPLLGGGSLGVSKYCRKDDEVSAFFRWFYDHEIAEQVTLLGGASVNDFIYSNQNVMDQYPWLKFAKDLEYRGVRESAFPTGHNFNLRKVEKIIGLGVKNVMNQMMSMEEAIDYINARLSEKEFLAL
ncbi:extracellular solute-binding protein [Paenibacillus chitinolyticus]|uniref:extracellular solute-binding protein n=1 Tax=Paenibacillus chitinolyticus TaxID=79263 RepID=UPI0036DDA645